MSLMPTQSHIQQVTAFLSERVKRQAREADRLTTSSVKATNVCEARNPLHPYIRTAFAGTNLLLTFATNVTNMGLSAQQRFILI
jgi:hypothetical protein